jgi:FkbM family methyltransferase
MTGGGASKQPPFGALRPSPAQERVRTLGAQLPVSYWGRRFASLLLGPSGGRAPRAYDVEVFGGARARLHPFDNICEKRVFLTPQLWDGEERAALAAFIHESDSSPFCFVDVGANAGLYTLFAREECRSKGLAFRGLCIEAESEMQRRLAFNMEASGASGEVAIAPYAAGAADATLNLAVNTGSRGLSRIAPEGSVRVEARTLLRLLSDAGLSRIDALKIDIEGHEFPVLEAFLRDAPRALWPRFLILETSHEEASCSAKILVLGAGWTTRLETKRNIVAVL